MPRTMTVKPTAAASYLAQVAGHDIRMITAGPDRLTHLIAMIEHAETCIDMAFYAFAEDGTAQQVRDALIRASKRGVVVTLLLDAFGSADTADSFFLGLRRAGGTVRWFGTRWTPRYLIRNHQKLVIVDQVVALTGGFNIADAYFAGSDDRHGWHDIAVELRGPQVAAVRRWFNSVNDWLSQPNPRFRVLRRLVREWRPEPGPVSWLVGGPVPRLSPWTREVIHALNRAQSLTLSIAYFSPNAGILRRITRIVRRGGTAELVLPAYSDNAATVGASRLLYSYLLNRGVSVAEYTASRLHNKVIIIDDMVLIGSANLDMRSLYINMELMLCIRDAGFADQCRAIITAQRRDATPITLAMHKARLGWLTWLRWAASWLIVSTIDYTVTRRLNMGLDAKKATPRHPRGNGKGNGPSGA